jgi:hypothetical protein
MAGGESGGIVLNNKATKEQRPTWLLCSLVVNFPDLPFRLFCLQFQNRDGVRREGAHEIGAETIRFFRDRNNLLRLLD